MYIPAEPALLARSRPIVEYILSKARATGEATVWAVTNATEPDDYRDLLGPGLIEQLQITLHGPAGSAAAVRKRLR